MGHNRLVIGVLTVAVASMIGCSPPSEIDETMMCGGIEYQLGKGEGGEAYMRVDNKWMSCEKYVDGDTGYNTCCMSIEPFREEQEERAAREDDDDDHGGGHHGP